jgi:hypothetical protein
VPELEIVLEYAGPDVDDGAMSLDDLVPVLQGVAGAYGKVSGSQGLTIQHRLRLTAIRPGSAKLVLDVWDTLAKNAVQLGVVGGLVTAAVGILATIISVIQLKKHTRNEPYSTSLNGLNGSIAVINSQNVAITVSPSAYTVFKEKLIDGDLSRIARPLEEGKVISSALEVIHGAITERESISLSEKPLFDVVETTVTTTKETWLTGQINSMTKSTNSGHIYLSDGNRVHYRIKAERPSDFYGLFGHVGLVRVRCIAKMDENLRPTELEIFEMVPLQRMLPFPADGSGTEPA